MIVELRSEKAAKPITTVLYSVSTFLSGKPLNIFDHLNIVKHLHTLDKYQLSLWRQKTGIFDGKSDRL